MTDIVKRLRDGFRGQGLTRAIRRKEDEPYPGEPYMSMDDAMPLLNEAADEIERLRLRKDRFYDQTGDGEHNDWKEVCDTLEAKDAEIERLRGDYEKEVNSRVEHWRSAVEALQAENAKLREALDFIADTPMKWTKPQNDVYWANLAVAFAKVADDARAALQKDEGE